MTVTAAGEDYIYCVGSVSKVYATAAVMKLADEGKVDIDAPVTEYVPDFTLDDERYRDITVRMLMDHTSGIMGTTQLGAFCYEHGTLHDDMFLKILSKQRLKADPGKYAAYCNDGFDLLALIVENVTGMDYTDYVRAELAGPTGGASTGSAVDFETLGTPAPSFTPGNLHTDFGVTEALGAGGIYSTAADVADFGAAFFEGSTVLLSEKAKQEMASLWNKGRDDDPYKDGNGLGWDEVQMQGYEEAGVQVLLKGGDAIANHAALMVAPEEEISAAVLSNGGSSALNAFLADALLQTVLEERGIKMVSEADEQYDLTADIPAEYDMYEGFYSSEDSNGGAVICHVTFPDHKYMHVENIGPARRTISDLMLIKEDAKPGKGRFAELSYELEADGTASVDEQLFDARTAVDPRILSFAEGSDGEIYLRADYANVFPELGRKENRKYIGEKMGDNPAGQKAIDAWKKTSEGNLFLVNDPASSAGYENGIARVFLSEEMPGYAYFVMGSLASKVVGLTDEDHAIAFQTIPSSSNRDLADLTVNRSGSGDILETSTGLQYIFEKDVPVLDESVSDVELSDGKAAWFRVGEGLANSSIAVDRPEGCQVYSYNKYGSVVYSSHVKDAGDDIPLPADGYIVFLGKTGQSVQIK